MPSANGTKSNDGLRAIIYSSKTGKLQVLDQLKLPHETVYDDISTCEEAFDCIEAMRVRGAPAIAIVAALALAVELFHKRDGANKKSDLVSFIDKRLDFLMESRPTAVDLSNAIRNLRAATNEASSNAPTADEEHSCADIRKAFIETAQALFDKDSITNKTIGRFGAEYLRALAAPVRDDIDPDEALKYFTTSPPNTEGAPDQTYRKISVLTHCNTGSLATSGHGTALGIIRDLYNMNYLEHAYCTETRPYNQGSRLTAYELMYEGIPSTLITDSMAGALFSRMKESRNISAVIVGADRVTRNGDTANKIGTYTLAVLAKAHGISFVVAAPTTSIDLLTPSGAEIVIEDRKETELTQITGAIVDANGVVDTTKSARVAIADQRIPVWNPSFDVTPSELISAIVTENGVVTKDKDGKFKFQAVVSKKRWEKEVGERESGDSGTTVLTTSSGKSGNSDKSGEPEPFVMDPVE